MSTKLILSEPKFLLSGGETFGNIKLRYGYRVFRQASKVQVLEAISYGYVSLMPPLKEAVNNDFLQISRVIQVGKRTSIAFTISPSTLDLMNTYLKNGGALALFFLGGDLYFYLERGGEQQITKANQYSWELYGGGPTADFIGMSIPVYPLAQGTVFNYGLSGYHRIDISPNHSIYVLATKLPFGDDIKPRLEKLSRTREFINRQGKTIPFRANYVKTLREAWGLSLRDVEGRGGAAKSTVAYLEKQQNATMRKSTVLSLATAMSVAPEEILEPIDDGKEGYHG